MLVKFFARGSGGGKGVADYLMGKDRQREGATVLRGDLEQTKEIIDGLDFSRNYTAGVLSFEEKHTDLTRAEKEEIMNRFEEALFPGLEPNQYEITWIEHTDKNDRLELNFVVANVELTTGKRLQPYYHKVDKNRIDNCKQLINHDYKLSDPDDPEKKRTITTAKDLPKNKKEAVKAIDKAVTNMVMSGEIKDRQGVVDFLENAGFEVARQTKQSISIKDPDGGKNIRLKGALYEQNFTADTTITEAIARATDEYRSGINERIQSTQKLYREQLERTAERNKKLYGRADRASEATSERSIRADERGASEADRGLSREYNEIDRSDQENAENTSRANTASMDDYNNIDDDRNSDSRNYIFGFGLSGERGSEQATEMGEISGILGKPIREHNDKQMQYGRSDIEILRANRPTIQGQILGRERRSNDSSTDKQITEGNDNDGSGKTFIEYVRELGEAISRRADSIKNTIREAITRYSDISRAVEDVCESNQQLIISTADNYKQSTRDTAIVAENNQTLNDMITQSEQKQSRGFELSR